MNINVKIDENAIMPTKAHETDAGFDLYTPEAFDIYPHGSAVIDTGVHMEIPSGYCGLLVSKSGLNVKHGMMGTGLIDSGYNGSIRVKLYRSDDSIKVYHFEAGDKISQLIILPVPEVTLVQVENLADTERGDKGFGSSGR